MMWFKDFQIKEKMAAGKKYPRLELTKALSVAGLKRGENVRVVVNNGVITIQKKQYEP